MTFPLLLRFLVCCAPLAFAGGSEDPAGDLRGLDAGEARVAAEALEALVPLGEPAARRALEELLDDRAEPALGRKWRARLVARAGTAANLPAALLGLADPDPAVRHELVLFLARPGLDERLEERVAALEALAVEDPSPVVRARAVAGLAELDEAAALLALNRLLDHLPSPERVPAALGLARAWRARAFVQQRVRAGFAPLGGPGQRARGIPRTPDDVLAALLPAYGTLLAEQPAGGETAADRVPLVLGLRHPEPAVRAAAALGFDRLIQRLKDLSDIDRALRILDAMDAEGFDRRVLLYQRSLLSLRGRPDPAEARRAALALRELCGDAGDPDDRDWRVSASYLEALAQFAAGDCEQAAPSLADAGQRLDGLLAERLHERRPELAGKVEDWLHLRARVELFEALRLAAVAQRRGGRAETLPDRAFELLRHMHELELEAQAFAQEHKLSPQDDLDIVLDDELSPVTLLLETPGLRGWTPQERIAAVALVARGIRSVAPDEMPGFEPFAGLARSLSEPLHDLSRQAWYVAFKDAYVGALTREFSELRDQRSAEGERGELDAAVLRRLENLWVQIKRAGEQEPTEFRFPSTLALRVSATLREEGARPREARELVLRMRNDLDGSGHLQSSYEGMEIAAQIDASIGAAYMDEGAPQRAEVELEKAVERLEEFERALAERGFPDAIVARIRLRRSTVLVSLAVNANVKLGQPDRALAYFERAYALRQDDFMKVLLACYRARSNEDEAARRILRDVSPAPELYYNLACTYALLGEADRALQFLHREFEENHVGAASRAKQQDWAREDPDLKSLRGDPRFVAITGA